MIGETISHFQVIEKLGEGGMGVVYKARDLNLGRTVALKFLPHLSASSEVEKQRFHHEGRAASALNHPNITTIYEIQEANGQIFLAMEYVEGETLKQQLARNPLTVQAALDIIIQVCSGLAAAHKKEVVHRDIKSDNILVTPAGDVKITDFGLAKLQGASRVTTAGSTLGTAAYMSPEQAKGEDVDRRTDIFSAGVVLYELLAGRLPFRGEHQAALLYAVVNEEPLPVVRFNDRVSPGLERIVAKALAKEKEERYQHADEMLVDLKRERKYLEIGRTGPQPVAPAAVPSSTHRGKHLTRYLIPAAAILVLVLLLVIFNPFNLQVSLNKGAAAEQSTSLAVLYFQNIPDPADKDHTGDMLTDLLITSLSQDKALQVVSRERLYDIQKDMGQGDVKAISPSDATRLAERAGVSMMLLGSILQQEPSLVITARVVNVKSGNIVSSQRLGGFSRNQVFSLVDTLSLLVRGDVAPRLSAADETRSVAEVTTSSPEAYRYYSEGLDLVRRYHAGDGEKALKRAVEIDSNFAMAYYALGSWRSADVIAGPHYLQKAWDLRGRVTEKERLRIESSYLAFVEFKLSEAAEILEAFVQKYPHEIPSYTELAITYSRMGRQEKALEIFQRVVQRDSLEKHTWNDLAYSLAGFNRREDALRAVNRYLELLPGEPNPLDSKGDMFLAFGEMDSAAAYFKKAVSLRPDFPSAEKLGYKAVQDRNYGEARKYFRQLGATPDMLQRTHASLCEAVVLMHQGKLRAAREMLMAQLPGLRSEDLGLVHLDALDRLAIVAREMNDRGMLMQVTKEGIDIVKNARGDPVAGRDRMVIALQKQGDRKGARNLLDQLEDDLRQKGTGGRARYLYARGFADLEEGRFEQAVTHFSEGFQPFYPNRAPQLLYGIALLKAGRVDEAVEEFERATWWIPISFPPMSLLTLADGLAWPIAAVKAHYWLGVAYEQLGRKNDAAGEYRTFLEIWKDADFPSPEMKDARSRLERL